MARAPYPFMRARIEATPLRQLAVRLCTLNSTGTSVKSA